MLLDILRGGLGSFDLVAFLTEFLTSLPVFVLALSAHEAAHAYIAYRCGDPTAKMMGRLTLNPIKHLDPFGFLLILFVGVGYAKPVPVNPHNYRHPRRDDIFVSLAGITMNLILCVFGLAVLYAMVGAAIPRGYALDGSWKTAFVYAASMREYLIEPQLGAWVGYVYAFFVNFAVVNLSLALFNLLPIPPLDGYHVFNDLLLKRALFASEKIMRIGQGVVMLLAFTGLLGKALSFVINGVLQGAGTFAYAVFTSLS